MSQLILLRHGESKYNQKNLFTGWTDTDLSEQGQEEARQAGRILKQHQIYPDICFTSWLKRAIHTAHLTLAELEWEHINQQRSWKLNERHYGDWQGRNKDEVLQKVGETQFKAIRRGYDTPPPPLPENDSRSPQFEAKYQSLDPSLLPRSESLHQTQIRTLNYFYQAILPQLAEDKTVLISAHGNTLRALMMHLENISPEDIVEREIPTGLPMLYTFDNLLNTQAHTLLNF